MAATITSRRPWMHPCATSSSRRATPTRRARSSARSRSGADDRGEFRQRDTYFAGRHGPAEAARARAGRLAHVGRADRVLARADRLPRPDSTEARASSYRRVPVADAAPLHEALDAAYGTLVDGREAPPPAAVGGRAHPPRRRRRASAPSSSSRRVADAGLRPRRRAREGRAAARGARDRGRESDRHELRRPPARGDGGPDGALPAPASWARTPRQRVAEELLRAADEVMHTRSRAVLALPGRRRAARRGRRGLRRRERRERLVPAGPVRGGLGDRRAGRRRRRRGSPRWP